MKPIINVSIAGKQFLASSYILSLELSRTGTGFVTVESDEDLTKKIISIDLGYNTNAYRYFSGYIERCQDAETGSKRLFIREIIGSLQYNVSISLQHPTLKDVTDAISAKTEHKFHLAEKSYSQKKIPHFQHSGTGLQLIENLGRSFNIPEYIHTQLPTGEIYVGAKSDFILNKDVQIPKDFIQKALAGNTIELPLIPAIRPGVIVNGNTITKVEVQDHKMRLSWQNGEKSPEQRNIERLFPEIGAKLHVPRKARIISATEEVELGAIHDPFRPKYAVNVQLLDENGEPAKDTPVFNAVPLPVQNATEEGGNFHFPPEGSLVEMNFLNGRPDQPIVRQILPDELSLPAIKPGEVLRQQRAEVNERITQEGHIQRNTDQQILESSASRKVVADSEEREITTRKITVAANDTKTVVGTQQTSASKMVNVVENDHALVVGQNVITKIGANKNSKIADDEEKIIGRNLTEKIGKVKESVAGEMQKLIAPVTHIGSESINILTLLMETLDLIQELSEQVSKHKHSDHNQTPTNASSIAAVGTSASASQSKYKPYIS